ncbi:DUF4129 domain-containing protein [Geothrix oryzisoli]|uniref:DUF4129 domain-containing protein n=1 Tax=Geothrix oryzisoli TaxID=2922721 RepID=UPI001FAB9E56|nr:DUF4129 domain-containing protein [Geothrix oryzisoli]
MKPGTMGFVPRARTAMEAVDLGLGLLQAHWRPVAGVWGLQVLFLLGLFLPFLFRTPLWCLLGYWWLKPWLDRGVLFVLSRAVFGQSASVWDFLREWRAVHRRGLAAGLLWRRLSPLRSYVLPIFQLEGLHGAGYRQRARVLTRQSAGAGFLLTCSGWLFTLMTLVGFLALLQGMMPPGSRVELWSGFDTMTLGFQWFLTAVGILALTLTEPLFVAGGFGLYLNRRTHLEGWDLELAFRRLAARLSLVVLLLLGARSLGAQEPPPAPDGEPVVQAEGAPPTPKHPAEGPLRPQEEAHQRAQRILKEDPAFRHTEEIRVLSYEPTGREPHWLRSFLDFFFAKKEPAKPSGSRNLDFLKGLWDLIALVGKVMLVGGLLAFVLWLIYRFRHRLGLPVAREPDWEAPAAVAGLDIRPESLPPDVPAAARHLFVRGEPRAALALLYRAALAELVHRKGMEIPASATEGDCLRAAGDHLDPGPAAIFKTLTLTWQRLAYKDDLPTREAFEGLCEAWPAAFGGRS